LSGNIQVNATLTGAEKKKGKEGQKVWKRGPLLGKRQKKKEGSPRFAG